MRTIYRERIHALSSLLGRHIHHDSESRRYTYDTPDRALANVRHTRHTPILDQGNLGSCTGNAGIGCLSTDPYFPLVAPNATYAHLNEADAIALYSTATGADDYPGQYPPTDTGSDGLTIAKVLKNAGMISGYQHTFTLTDALLALMDYPLITGINWYNSMFTPDPDGIVAPGGGLAGGHEIVVDEYVADQQLVGFTNSWGTGWGKNGRFYMHANDYGNLLSESGDVIVFVPLSAPAPTPTPDPSDIDKTFAAVLKPWVAEHHVGDNAKTAKAAKKWLAAKNF